MSALLEVDDLRVDLAVRSGNRTVVDGLSLRIGRSEIFGLVGESGCGKSVAAQTLTRLLPNARIVRGGVRIAGVDVAKASEDVLERLRGGTVGHVFQEPGSALTPWMTVGRQIREVLDLHRPVDDPEGEVVRLLDEVGVRDPALRARDYPHQLSGGMQQRVLIAMAVAARPGLLVADEPTTALDATLQAQVLELFRRLRDRTGASVLLISHNLAVVARHADRIGVMYAGELVETGPAASVLGDPRHPYTRGLVAAIPTLPPSGAPLPTIPGQVASIDPEARGCRFAPRCPIAVPACLEAHPGMSDAPGPRQVRCPRVTGDGTRIPA